MGLDTRHLRPIIRVAATLLGAAAGWGAPPPPATVTAGGFAYIGTLDHKLLILDEEKEEVVGEILLGGVPRVTALSFDQKKLHLLTTQMVVETVDLATRQVVSHFTLSDEKSRPRIPRTNGPSIAVDPGGRYLYATMKVAVREADYYRMEPAQFVVIDLQDKRIARTFPFPQDMDQGFGFGATYKVSADGKLLYVFQDDVLVYDLATFQQVDRIQLSKPEFPGASPYHLNPGEDPYEDGKTVTSVFVSVDPMVHKGTLGLGTLDLLTHKADFKPIGPALPMMGFLVSPDHKRGYSVMYTGAGANRRTEWWVWDLAAHKVIKREEFPTRPTFRFGMSGDGRKLYIYGAGSTLEIFDAATLKSDKVIYLNKDTTTNLVTLARR
jgi:hypothetical protein